MLACELSSTEKINIYKLSYSWKCSQVLKKNKNVLE